jgi:hypothetical protein
MTIDGFLHRDDGVVWRDIAGEIVIADRDNSTIRVLNRVASVIWVAADGAKAVEDISNTVFDRFDVSREEARADSEAFISELLKAGLVHMSPSPTQTTEA